MQCMKPVQRIKCCLMVRIKCAYDSPGGFMILNNLFAAMQWHHNTMYNCIFFPFFSLSNRSYRAVVLFFFRTTAWIFVVWCTCTLPMQLFEKSNNAQWKCVRLFGFLKWCFGRALHRRHRRRQPKKFNNDEKANACNLSSVKCCRIL